MRPISIVSPLSAALALAALMIAVQVPAAENTSPVTEKGPGQQSVANASITAQTAVAQPGGKPDVVYVPTRNRS